ncbi:hypothetical protein C8J56DRAFT_920558 [Mycena floridula]|nr:hypothetical protein C8J56DRAFT_920558 [Mycena floridula]
MPPKSERDEFLSATAMRFFSAMVDDLVMDATLDATMGVLKRRAVCEKCNTCCNAVHLPQPYVPSLPNKGSPSRAETPVTGESSKSANGTSTPTSIKNDGTLYLDCVNCSRPIASNRYAPHLSTCMGLGSARRAAVRANVKSKQPSDADRSPSPMSEVENISEDKSPGKGKMLSKTKRVDEAEFNFKRKRPGSPQISPNKSPKKKPKAAVSPVSRLKSIPDSPASRASVPPPLLSGGSQSKIPSKLRDSSTASFLESSSRSSRSSSPEATPLSSFSRRSQSLTGGNGKAKGTGPPKRVSPPRPPPPSVSLYMEEDAGDETGSSTDTDSL